MKDFVHDALVAKSLEVSRLQRETEQLHQRNADLQAEVARLRAALTPFARMYDTFPLTWGPSVEHETIYAVNDTELKYADFWRAHNALEGGAK